MTQTEVKKEDTKDIETSINKNTMKKKNYERLTHTCCFLLTNRRRNELRKRLKDREAGGTWGSGYPRRTNRWGGRRAGGEREAVGR